MEKNKRYEHFMYRHLSTDNKHPSDAWEAKLRPPFLSFLCLFFWNFPVLQCLAYGNVPNVSILWFKIV